MEQILVIDDEIALCELLTKYLTEEYFQVESVHDGETGLKRISSAHYDLILLDIALPTMSGFDVLRRLRATSNIPVVLISGRNERLDRILGLEIGADGYLAKPFDLRELLAHIRAVLRRCRPLEDNTVANLPAPDRLMVGDVEMDIGARVVRCSGRQTDLTCAEFRLLETLLRNAGQIVSREGLTREVLGRSTYFYDRCIDVHIAKLRKKLGSPPSDGGGRIKTIRGLGYLYASASPTGSQACNGH